MSTDAVVTCWEDVPDRLFGRSNGSQRTLSVDCGKDCLKFTVLFPELFPDVVEGGTKDLPGVESIAELLQHYASALYRMSVGLSGGSYREGEERESALISLQHRGAELFRSLVPAELQTEIRSWADQSVTLISTNEQWIPWELMYDGKGFLGQRTLLVRMPRLPMVARAGTREWGGRPSQPESSYGQKVLNVIGGGLDSQIESCQRLFQDFGKYVQVSTLCERPISALLREIPNADLVHFTCHGHLNPLRLQIGAKDDPALNLLVHSIKSDDFCIKPRCLVYANACSSAATELSFEKFVGFAWEFYAKGAAAFIGTLGAVPTVDALSFAQQLYSRLASGETDNIYSAYQATREEAIKAGPACLFFCIYGNYRDEPSFKFSRRETSGSTGGGRPSS